MTSASSNPGQPAQRAYRHPGVLAGAALLACGALAIAMVVENPALRTLATLLAGVLFGGICTLLALRPPAKPAAASAGVPASTPSVKQGSEHELLQRVNLAAQAAGVRVFDWDLINNRLSFDQSATTIGTSGLEEPLDPEKFIERQVHPDDLYSFRREMGKAVKYKTHVVLTYRAIQAGEMRPLQLHGQVFRDESGRATRVLGVTVDLSAQMEYAARLEAQANEQRRTIERLDMATEAAGIGIWDWDMVTNQLAADTHMAKVFRQNDKRQFPDAREFIKNSIHPEDLPEFQRVLQTALKHSDTVEHSYRSVEPDGSVHNVRLTGKIFRNEAGAPIRFLSVTVDTTKIVEAAVKMEQQAKSLQEMVARFNMASTAAGISVWEWDVGQQRIVMDQQRALAAKMHDRVSPQYFLDEVIHPDDREAFLIAMQRALEHETEVSYRYRARHADGEIVTLQLHGRIFRDEAGKAQRVLGITRNITEQVRDAAEIERQHAQQKELLERLNLATEVGGLGVWDWQVREDRLVMDNAVARGYGVDYHHVDHDARAFFTQAVHPDDRPSFDAAMNTALASGDTMSHRYRILTMKGALVHVQINAHIFRDAAGEATRMLGVTTNVTAEVRRTGMLERQAEEERALRDRLDLATRTAGIGVWDMDLATLKLNSDDEVRRILGVSGELDEPRLLASIHAEDRAAVQASIDKALASTGGQDTVPIRHRVVRENGEISYIQTHIRVFRDEAGRAVSILGVTWDVNEEVEHAQELRAQAERMQRLLDRFDVAMKTAGIAPWEIDASTMRYVWVENRMKAVGTPDMSPPEYGAALVKLIHPDDFEEMRRIVGDAIEGGQQSYSYRYRLMRPDGLVRHMQSYAHIVRDEQGKALRMLGATTDVTNEVQTNALLQRQAEQERVLLDRLSIATQSAGISSWELNFGQKKMVWADNFKDPFPPADDEDFPAKLAALQHPDDRGAFMQAVHAAVAIKTDLISYRYRARDRDRWEHYQNYARLFFDEAGHATRALGVTFNISREIEAAEKLEQQAVLLRDAERRMQRASLSSSEGHWETDLRTGQTWLSSSHHTLLGHAEGELPTTYEDFRKLEHRDDLIRSDAVYARHIANGEPYDVEVRLLTASDGYRWFRRRGTAERDAQGRAVRMSGSIHDIHQQKLAEDALKLAQRRFERAINGTQDGLWELEADGTAWCSPRVGELLGYEHDELASDTHFLRMFLHPDDANSVAMATQAHFQQAQPYDVEIRLRTKSSDYRWYRARATADRDATGRPLRLSGSLQDVSEARAAREELMRATQAAEAANSAKSEFLANVSHEIRTPMNGIIGMTGLLLDTTLDRSQRDFAETIRGSADSLLIVINDILDFSKIEAGKLDIEAIELDLRGNVEDVGGTMAFQAAAKNLELVVHVHPEVPERVIGDPQRVRQCLINLVGNAVKFTRDGEIVIEVRNVGRRDGKVLTRFEVRDTGIGIKKETLDTLFQPFVQADSSTTRHFGGTGLGLSIVRRLVEMMGGQVGVESEVGKGSTFWFMLPLEPATEQSAHPPVDLTRLGRRIVVVDDNETNRRVVAGQLMHAGYEVSLASGGAEAIQMLRQAAADKHPFEVVLADYELHDMDGAKLGEAINADEQISRARVVILTSLDRHGDMRRFASMGFAGYLTKPVRARELFECMDKVLARDSKEWHLQSQPIVTKGVLAAQDTQRRYRGNVLLVEDNAVNQKVAVRFLERMGCKVRVADNGAEGVKAYREMPFDIVLMDLQMPVMDGLTATRQIRELEGDGPATPIVALTANAMSGQLERCMEAGMNGFLTKPIEIARLHEALQRFGLSADALEDTQTAKALVSNTPVDLGRLNELTEGDPAFTQELAETFVASGELVMQEVNAALAALDRPALARAAHKLKGASANIHANALRDLAYSLETQAASLDRPRLTEMIEQLAVEFTRAAEFLKEQAPAPAAKAG